MCLPGFAKSELERESEIETAVEQAFSAIAEAQPEGVLQASREAGEGATLAALSELAKGGVTGESE